MIEVRFAKYEYIFFSGYFVSQNGAQKGYRRKKNYFHGEKVGTSQACSEDETLQNAEIVPLHSLRLT